MSAIEISEFKSRIEEWVAAVERGETVDVARDGTVVARLSPVARRNIVVCGGKRLPDLTEFRAQQKVTKLEDSVRALRDEERY